MSTLDLNWAITGAVLASREAVDAVSRTPAASDAAPGDLEALSRAWLAARAGTDAALRELGRARPALSLSDLRAMWHTDRVLQASVRERWRSFADPIDVSTLTNDDDEHDQERWSLVAGMCDDFRVEERDGGTVDGVETTVWTVIDHGYAVPREVGTYDDEDDADQRASEGNEWRDAEHLNAFPFAWNTGWVLDCPDGWTGDLAAAGFRVYDHDRAGRIAGIDGGGYDFWEAHMLPAVVAIAAKCGWLLDTDTGPRRVEVAT